MYGDSKGMIAIIEALRDADLQVTVMDGRYQKAFKEQATEQPISRILALKRSLGVLPTNSEMTSKLDKSCTTQICEGRHTTTYQMAHCNQSRPASLQVTLSKSSPQRSCYLSHTSNGLGFTPALEAFVCSLRKYPRMSPGRSGSAEMVQRLINYTQSKHLKKLSHKSRSRRSLREITNTNKQKCANNSIQSQANGRKISLVKDDEFKIEEKKDLKLQPTVPDVKCIQYYDKYDYFKHPSQNKSRHSAEVRYLSDITKYLRDKLQNISGDRPVMCQKMRNRYTNHERQYHPERQRPRVAPHQTSRANTANMEVQASGPSISGAVLTDDTENINADMPSLRCYKNCCALRAFKKLSIATDASPKRIIDEAIMEWVKSIPVNSAENYNERKNREDLINQLTQNLEDIANSDDFYEQSRALIENCVNEMPLWNPGNESEQNILKSKVIENLHNKLINQKSTNIFKEYFDKPHELTECVSKWLDDIAIEEKDSKSNLIVTERIINDLVEKFNDVEVNENNKQQLFESVKKNLPESVNNLPLELKNVTCKTVNNVVTGEEDIINQEENNYNSKHINMNKNKDEERENLLNASREAENQKRGQSNDFTKGKIKETTSTNVKLSRGVNNNNVKKSQSNINSYNTNEDLAKGLLENNVTENRLSVTPKEIVDNDNIEMIATKIANILMYQINQNKRQDTLNRSTLNENDDLFHSIVKELIKDWGQQTSNLDNSAVTNIDFSELAKQILDIRSSNMRIQDIIGQIKNIGHNKTIDAAVEKLRRFLEDANNKQTEDQLTKKIDQETLKESVCAEIKDLMEYWGDKITKLQISIDKNQATDEITKQLMEIKVNFMNLKEILSHMHNTVPDKSVNAIITKLIDIKQKGDKLNDELLNEDIEKSNFAKLKQLIQEWSDQLWKLQVDLNGNKAIDDLTKQINQIKLTNTNIENILKPLENKIPNETLEGITARLIEMIGKDNQEKILDERNIASIRTDLKKAISSEVNKLLKDWESKLANLDSQVGKSKDIEELTNKIIEIQLMITNIEEMLSQMKALVSSETVESVSMKISSILIKEQEKMRQGELNKETLINEIAQVVRLKVKEIMDEWSKNPVTEKLSKMLLETELRNTNIEKIINQIKYTIPSQTVEGIADKLSELFTEDNQDRKDQDKSLVSKVDKAIDKGVNTEIKSLMEDCNKQIEGLINSIEQNTIIPLNKQLTQSTNTNIENGISQVKNHVPVDTAERVAVTLSKYLNKSQNKDVTSNGAPFRNIRKAKDRLILNEESAANNFSNTDNTHLSRGNQSDIYSQSPGPPSMVENATIRPENNNYKGIHSTNSSVRRDNDNNIFKKDKDSSYTHSMHHSDRSRYHEDTRSLTDLHDRNSGIETNKFKIKYIEELIEHIKTLQTREVDQDIILDEIDDYLDTLLRNNELYLTFEDRDIINKKLLTYLEDNRPRKRWDQSDDKRKAFLNDISDIIDSKPSKTNNSHTMTTSKRVNILEKDTNGDMNETPSGNFVESIREELNELLQQYNVSITNKELEDMISQILSDQVMRGVDMDKTRGILYSMLQEDNIPKSKAADISMKLVDRVKEMSLAYKALDSNIAFNRSKVKTSPFHNEAFKRSAEKVVLDFIDEFCNNTHSQNITKQKVLGSIKKLVDLIINILSNPDEDTEDILKGAIWEFFAENSFQSESPIVDLVEELGDRVLNIVIYSSTPKKDKRSILKRNTAETTMNHENRASIKKDLCYCDAGDLESDYVDILRIVISYWIEGLHMSMDEEFRMNMIEDLVRDTMDWQRYLQINPTTIEPDRDLEHLKYQVFRWLNNLSDFHEFSNIVPGVDNLMKKIKDVFLHNSIKNTKQNHSEFGNKIAEETFDSILEEWFVSLPPMDPKSCLELLEIEKLKSDFKFRLERLCNNLNNAEMREEIRKFLIDFPFVTKNNNDKFIDDKVNDLIELLGNVPLINNRMHGDTSEILIIEDEKEIKRNVSKDLSISGLGNFSLQSIGPLNSMNTSCNNLNDYIVSWFENLFEIKDVNALMYLKQNLASRLINKINELNLNKDILDDEYLYKELVEDEINSLLNELPINVELTSVIKDKKIDLIYKILESREKSKKDIACQQYKRNLRDVISKSLPILSPTALQELAALDILKDNLADAYINLRFYGADNYLKEKYKTKITNEITKFCTEYLKICPQLPVTNEKLNTVLFDALEKVDTPGEETLAREIEQTRIRDEINEWLKEMPVKEQNKTELLQQNKKIALLAKALHDIESEMEVTDTTNQMKNLILKFLQKLPLQISNKEDINNFADKLVENLYRSESSRRYSQSKCLKSLRDISIIALETVDSNGDSKIRRKSVLGSTNVDSIIKPAANKETVDSSVGCNMNELMKNNTVEGTNLLPQIHTVISIPPSTLNTADKAHLEEIRQRTSNAIKYTLVSRKRDAAVSPVPVDVAIQTDIPVLKTNNVPNTSKQTSPQENYKIIKPIVHSIRSKSLVRQSAIGTEVDDNQETKATRGVVKAAAGLFLNNEQRQKNEMIFESKQSAGTTSALASTSPKHSIESVRLTIRDANQNLETLKCPGIQMIAPCHNKTCPSVKDLIHQELDKEEHQRGKEKTFLAENTNAGPSTEPLSSKSSQTQNREISPKVIIKEYYWNSNTTSESHPNQSKDNTNINDENQYNNVAQNDTRVIVDESKAKQDINEEFNENSCVYNINNTNINKETSTSDICPIAKRWHKHIISISTQTSDPCDENVKYNNLVNEDLRSGKSFDIPRKTKARVLSDGNVECQYWSNDNDLNSDNSNERSKRESDVSRNIRLRRRDRFNENTPRNINKDEPRHGKSKVTDRNARKDWENVSNIRLRNVVTDRLRREVNNPSKNVRHDVFLDGNNTPRGIISNRKSRRHVSVGDLCSTHINDQLRGQNGTEDTIRCRCKEGFTRPRCTHRCPHPSSLYFK